MNTPRVLIVDDEKNITFVIQAILKRQSIEATAKNDSAEALKLLEEESFDAILTDLYMPGPSGMEILEFCKKNLPQTPVILMTAFGTIDTAVTALKNGAFDFITKPFDQDDLIQITQKALHENHSRQKEPVHILQNPQVSTLAPQGSLLLLSGQDSKVLELRRILQKTAPTQSPVLITGERGTGKELLAQEIHRLSSRAQKPFIKLNCSGLSQSLLENELFGQERGILTGSPYSKPGKLELANGGTLFLDEIQSLPWETQTRLLDFLRTQEFERVGGITSIRSDVRIIAASLTSLDQLVSESLFQEELFYRFSVAVLRVPALRERESDLHELISKTTQEINRKLGKSVTEIHADALRILQNYSWPGNLRQLETAIERALLMTDTSVIRTTDLPEEILNSVQEHSSTIDSSTAEPQSSDFKEIVRKKTQALERELISDALKRTSGNVTHAAESLGLSRKGLQIKIKDLGIHVERLGS